MDFTKIIARVKAILTSPKTEWPVIVAEPATVKDLYIGYIAILAALPAIAGFIKGSLIGYSAFGITVRTPFVSGITGMVLTYVLALVVAYVVALVINALAPTFEGQKDMTQALKTVAYAWTASWIAGIALIVPMLGWLVALAGFAYAIYLVYLGLPSTMKCPPEKAVGYTAVSMIIAMVLSWIVGLIAAGVIGTAALSGATMSGTKLGSTSDSVTFDSNSALGKLAAMGQQAEQASKAMEAAQKSGDTAAQSAAMGKMLGAVTGTDGSVESLSTDQVKAFIPDSLLGAPRTSISAQRNNAMGIQMTEASAEYRGDNGNTLRLEVSDSGGAKGLMAMAAAMVPEQEEQTEHGYEKTYTAGGRLIHEKWDNQSNRGEYSVTIGQRFQVKVNGRADSIDQLKRAVASVDLAKLDSLKNQGVAKN